MITCPVNPLMRLSVPVKVYKDVLGYYQDELFSDAFPIKELPALYAVTAKSVTKDRSVKVNVGQVSGYSALFRSIGPPRRAGT